MQTVLIVIHLLIVIALVGVVLIQRSEGGGLGIGGGSGFMTARGTKNALTRLTAILALCFFATSIALVVLDSVSNPAADIINRIPAKETQVPTQNTPSTATEQIPTGEGQAPANNANQPAGSNQSGNEDQKGSQSTTTPDAQKSSTNGNKSAPVTENPVPQQQENPVPNN